MGLLIVVLAYAISQLFSDRLMLMSIRETDDTAMRHMYEAKVEFALLRTVREIDVMLAVAKRVKQPGDKLRSWVSDAVAIKKALAFRSGEYSVIRGLGREILSVRFLAS
jgi:hypothetical protein